MKPKTILLVDDEAVILNTMANDLTEEGFDVQVATSGEEALPLIREVPVDLLITDLMMEGMDGLALAKEARQVNPDLSVIILTGFGDMNTAIEALRLGADDYLLKPCSLDELLIRINSVLEKQELRRKIKLYENILPVCVSCKKIRNDGQGQEPGSGDWLEADEYLNKKTRVKVSHGLCPDCFNETMKKLDEHQKD
ncbi:MAG: response regulator [Proteobacteria bacterium]|nr:response regulator [Pseudomonadota bacterium]MBU1687602.1 response regulator [Pseudomonadota bacterium]